MGVSAIQEQRDSMLLRILCLPQPCLTATSPYSNSKYNQEHYEGRCKDTRVLPLRETTNLRQWKILVVDTASRKIIDNVVREDDILNENIASMLHEYQYWINH